MTRIPTFQAQGVDTQQTIELDGFLVTVRITWNERTEYFALSAETENGAAIGIKLVPGYPLLRSKRSLLPDLPGDFAVLKMDDSLGDDIGYNDLGNGWDLIYLTAEERQTWEAARGLG